MKKIFLITSVTLFIFVFFGIVYAQDVQEGSSIDYGDGLILDSDLDGLTDLGEEQKFGTDSQDPDSDGDGFLDGAEVLGGSDPLDQNYPMATKIIKETRSLERSEIPWPWYLARGFGLASFLLLYLSILFGLAIRIPKLNLLAKPIFSLDLHKWFSLHAIIFSLAHAVVLLFDKTISFSLSEVFVPLKSEFEPFFVAFGIIGFYLMVILVATSYFRKYFNYKIWRLLHFLNIFLYLAVAVHMWFIGTDMQNFYLRVLFLILNIFLMFFVLLNIYARNQRSKK